MSGQPAIDAPTRATSTLTVDVAPLFSDSPQERAYDVYREMRENAPVLKLEGTWLISTYDDVRAIVRDPDTWSSHYPEQFGTGVTKTAPPSARTQAALANGYPWVPTLLFQDGPVHRRHRGCVQRALNPGWMRRFEGPITAIAHSLVDAFAADGEVMFVREFAAPLPSSVFAEAFGVEPADRERFRAWSESIVDLGAPSDEERSVAIAENYVEFQHYLVERINLRRTAPSDDLLSRLLEPRPRAGSERKSVLTLPELVGICGLLLAAGGEPTTATLTALLYHMVADPGLGAALRGDRSLIPAAIDETLRLESPVAMFQRRASRDTEVRGQRIRRGEMATMIYASANRDPGHWPDPDEFRLGRPNIKDHLGFTHGPHHCVGAGLARAMVRIGVEVLLARSARIELDGRRPVELAPQLMTRAYRELPLIVSNPSRSSA